MRSRLLVAGSVLATLLVSACVYQPLYGSAGPSGVNAGMALDQVSVSEVDTRVGQQVRNHLLFLFHGGRGSAAPAYDLRIRAADSNRLVAATQTFRGNTAGTVGVTVSYDLIETSTNRRIDGGSRVANASYDRTGQNFANERAVRDAENRAAREVAEQIRNAVAAILSR
ncbi:MAG: LPS assembly lipoprotein LptE [Rhizobiaceae bacterium]